MRRISSSCATPIFRTSSRSLSRRPGTLVLRTFSKIYGLAGIRIGYGICDTEFASYLERARHPFNVNRLAEIAALAALDDEEARPADARAE